MIELTELKQSKVIIIHIQKDKKISKKDKLKETTKVNEKIKY